ncbi:MAG: hypothetical protein INR71_11535 [Terriglobus roseus]|nr:hypothetical protein [Terriglobus roseus]
MNPVQMVEKKTFLDEMCSLFAPGGVSTSTHRIKPGVHKWPFNFVLPQTLPESVEGMYGSYIVYNLHVSIDRGWSTRALTATKRVRIVRTLGADSIESINLEQVRTECFLWRKGLKCC